MKVDSIQTYIPDYGDNRQLSEGQAYVKYRKPSFGFMLKMSEGESDMTMAEMAEQHIIEIGNLELDGEKITSAKALAESNAPWDLVNEFLLAPFEEVVKRTETEVKN